MSQLADVILAIEYESLSESIRRFNKMWNDAEVVRTKPMSTEIHPSLGDDLWLIWLPPVLNNQRKMRGEALRRRRQLKKCEGYK